MNAKQLLEAMVAGRKMMLVELRSVEVGGYPAKPAQNGKAASDESFHQTYKVIVGDDSAEFKHPAPRGGKAAPVALVFKRGQKGVVEFRDFTRGKYGLGGYATSVELFTE